MHNWSGGWADLELTQVPAGPTRVYDLAVALEVGMPRHPSHPPFTFGMAKVHGGHGFQDGVSAAMEMFSMGAHVGTHIDGLGHVSKDGAIFGQREVLMGDAGKFGLTEGSIEETAPVMGAGHLIDAPILFGRDLTPADSIGSRELERWFDSRPAPQPGSIVLVRTGWMERFWSDSEQYIGLSTGLPGVSIDGARWLSKRGIIASGSDTMNYEHKPSSAIINLPVHVHFLVENGISIMESMSLDALARAGHTEFFFIAIPLRIKGGTGSPIRPVALVPLAQ